MLRVASSVERKDWYIKAKKAKKAQTIAEVEEEEFESSDSEHEEEENIPYADSPSETDVIDTLGNDNEWRDHQLMNSFYILCSGSGTLLMSIS